MLELAEERGNAWCAGEERERTNAAMSLLGIGRHGRKEQVFGKK